MSAPGTGGPCNSLGLRRRKGIGNYTNVERKEVGIDELCIEKCEGGGRAYARSLESYECRTKRVRDRRTM